MANYITHASMAEIMKIEDKRIDLDKNLLKTFSLGPDLLFSVKNGVNISHNYNTKNLFYNIINYIIENNLIESNTAISYLYSNIMHYELDRTIHPFIYYLTNDVPNLSIISFHMACEEYIGDYILKEKLNLKRKDISSSFFTSLKNLDEKTINQLVNHVYKKTYNKSWTFKDNKKTLLYLKLLNDLIKMLNLTKENGYLEFIGLYKYLEFTGLHEHELVNEDRNIWYNPITKEENNKSFIDLFDDAIALTNESIERVNKVLYNGKNISSLNNVFDNSSFDTNINCSYGKHFVKSYIKDNKKYLF